MVFLLYVDNSDHFAYPLSQYLNNVESWCKACGEGELPSELQDLEDTIHHHQGLYEHITAAYSEVPIFIIFSHPLLDNVFISFYSFFFNYWLC